MSRDDPSAAAMPIDRAASGGGPVPKMPADPAGGCVKRRTGGALLALAALAACAPQPRTVATAAPPSAVAEQAPAAPATMRYLYGSAEAAALGLQAYSALVAFVEARKGERRSVVLADEATLAAPRFAECGDRPAAVVFDMDETLVLNLGYERREALGGKGFDAGLWNRWEQSRGEALAPVPGAVEAVAALRRLGVTPIVNSNRTSPSAAAAEAALRAVGFGDFRHGETLFLKGDVDGGSGKDGRRREIARRFCVIAMAGDQLGDFSDGFAGKPSDRRALARSAAVAGLWGNGWFVLPNPVYGAGVAAQEIDELFPPEEAHWADPGDGDQ